ncbi:MAG TPA: hypothetical protein VGG21_06695 [Acidimicrobiales bacterium]
MIELATSPRVALRLDRNARKPPSRHCRVEEPRRARRGEDPSAASRPGGRRYDAQRRFATTSFSAQRCASPMIAVPRPCGARCALPV